MAGFLSLKREKQDLEERLAALRERIQKTREALTRVRQEQAEVAEVLRILSTESRDRDIEFALLRHQVERLEAELQKTEQTEKVSTLELSQLQSERVEFETRLKDAEKDMGEIEQRSKSGGEEIVQLAARLESLKAESTAVSKNLAGLTSAYAVKQERLSATETDLRRLSGEIDEMQRRLEANQNESAATLQAIAELEQGIQEGTRRIAEHESQIAEAEASLSRHMAALTGQREELEVLEERLRKIHAEREEAMDSRSRVEIERTRLENDRDHLEKSCRDEFHVPLAQIVDQIGEDSRQRRLEEVTQAYQQLRERVENFGAINMRALEEYQEFDERHMFLTHQRSDNEKSIADTQRAIAEINRRSVAQFCDAFTAIRHNFAEVFQLLFGGGQCDLRMLDEEDVLESGIDIIAQPPGKRLQNVLLLSGGEKALTAIALLVAIFRYRPSPFCVMDEVDAPLDDANIQRFTSLIKELSEQTQFILITHNKKTMEIAEALYGVTMEDPGVSQIVGVDFRPQLRAVAS
jgi:chromosome segregation protein